MKTLFDSIVINRLQMSSFTEDTTLACTVFESGDQYDTELVLSATSMNQLLNELALRDIEVDFEVNSIELNFPSGEVVIQKFFSEEFPVIIPPMVLDETRWLMRA